MTAPIDVVRRQYAASDARDLNALRATLAPTTLTPRDLPRDVEVVERAGVEGRYLFAINHTDADATISVGDPGTELLTDDDVIGSLHVPASW